MQPDLNDAVVVLTAVPIFATTALDADVPLRDVQDSIGHTDPRTTRLYDRSRDNLDHNATHAVAAALAGHAHD